VKSKNSKYNATTQQSKEKRDIPLSHLMSPSLIESANGGVQTIFTSSPVQTTTSKIYCIQTTFKTWFAEINNTK
jgi:hypothetical protein